MASKTNTRYSQKERDAYMQIRKHVTASVVDQLKELQLNEKSGGMISVESKHNESFVRRVTGTFSVNQQRWGWLIKLGVTEGTQIQGLVADLFNSVKKSGGTVDPEVLKVLLNCITISGYSKQDNGIKLDIKFSGNAKQLKLLNSNWKHFSNRGHRFTVDNQSEAMLLKELFGSGLSADMVTHLLSEDIQLSPRSSKWLNSKILELLKAMDDGANKFISTKTRPESETNFIFNSPTNTETMQFKVLQYLTSQSSLRPCFENLQDQTEVKIETVKQLDGRFIKLIFTIGEHTASFQVPNTIMNVGSKYSAFDAALFGEDGLFEPDSDAVDNTHFLLSEGVTEVNNTDFLDGDDGNADKKVASSDNASSDNATTETNSENATDDFYNGI